MAEIKTEFLFELRIPQSQSALVDMGQTPTSRLMYAVADSGTFQGPELKGVIIPMSGGDWSRVRSDMSIAIDVRLCLATDDGANIYLTYQGILAADSAENFQYMIDFAKKDDPAAAARRYYYRTTVQFETGADKYAWLNRTVAIGSGRSGDNCAIYEIFALK